MQPTKRSGDRNRTIQSRYDDLVQNFQLSPAELYKSNASPTGKAFAYISYATTFGFLGLAYLDASTVTFIALACFAITLCLILALADGNKKPEDPP